MTTNLLSSEDGKLAKLARLCRFSGAASVRKMTVILAIGTAYRSAR